MRSEILRRIPATGILLLAACVAAPWVAAQSDDPDDYGDDYASGDYGRVRYAEGAGVLTRASADEGGIEAEAAPNEPIFPGDRLTTGGSDRVEVQLSGGTLLRVDRDSILTFQSLPSPYAAYKDNAVLALDAGTIQIASVLGEDDTFRIDTRSSSVYLLGDGDFRVETDGTGRTRVFSRRGVAEVVGEGGSVLVRGGMRTIVYPDALPEDPRAYSAYASDGFDRWIADRETAYASRSEDDIDPEELPDEVRPYYGELASYGRWSNVPEYGWVWNPYDVPTGWRPYWDGTWCYGPHGYFWVSHEPWGWAPYRYGRWSWVSGFGWCWVPGRIFGGAWVSWSWGSAYVGWAPLDYWGRPAYIGGSLWLGRYDPGCWTFVDYHHIGVRDVRRYAVPVSRVPREDLGRARLVRGAPRVSPRRYATSPEWRDRAVREVAENRRIQIPPGDRARTSDRRLGNVEDRMIRRTVERERPGEIRSPVVRDRFPRRAAPDRPSVTDRGRGTLRETPTGRTETPRRESPRAQPERPDERPAAPDRRSLYDRISRPRDVRERNDAPDRTEPRREPPRRETPPPQRAEPRREPPRRESPPPQRAEPRREPPRPQAQPKREAPRAQPKREEPKKESGRSDGSKGRGKR